MPEAVVDLMRLRDEPLFVDLLLLGRISNSLRFAHTAPLEVFDEGTPRAFRQLNGAFFVQVAFALEALDTLKALNKHLQNHQVWQSEVVPLFRDPEIQALETETVRDLRRRIVFHFDRAAMEQGLAQARQKKSTTLLATRGKRRADPHFSFSDEVAVAYLVPTKDLDDLEYRETVGDWLERATNISLRIAIVVEKVAVDFARQLGLKGSWVEEQDGGNSHFT